MRCSFCDWANPEGSRFCNRCGTASAALVPTVRAARTAPVAADPPAPPVDPHLTQRLGGPDVSELASAIEARASREPVAPLAAPVAAPPAASPAPVSPAIESPVIVVAPFTPAILDVPVPRAAPAAPAFIDVPLMRPSPIAPAIADVPVTRSASDAPKAAPTATMAKPAERHAAPASSPPARDDAKAAGKAAKRRIVSDASSVSLAAIGVRSSRKTWALIAGAGVFLVGAGVAAGLVLARPSTHQAVQVAADELSELDPVPTAAAATLPAPPEGAEPPATIPSGRSSSARRATGGALRSFQERESSTATNAASAPRGTKVRVPRERAASGNIAELPSADTSDTPTSRAPDFEQDDGSSTATPPPWTGDSDSTSSAAPAPSAPSARRSSATRSSEPAPSLEDASADVGEGDDDDIEMTMYASRVRSVIRQYYRPRAQTCFDRAARNDPELRGTVVVNFTIAGGGQVRGARVVSNSTNHDEVGRCIVPIVNAWRLPPPPNDEALQIEMPFSR